ncbi:MAG: hypothetical protein QXN37_00795 [Candidatus Anstonellaceae archaeon]
MGKSKFSSTLGQMLSTELVISSAIFVAALAIFLFSWNLVSNSYYEEQSMHDMQTILVGISDMFVLSSGVPSDWENDDFLKANAFGFASSRNVLSPSKLSALSPMNGYYDLVKEKMGAGPFDIYLSVIDADSGSLLYSFGLEPDYTNSKISSAERLAILDDKIVRVRVQIWKKK